LGAQGGRNHAEKGADQKPRLGAREKACRVPYGKKKGDVAGGGKRGWAFTNKASVRGLPDPKRISVWLTMKGRICGTSLRIRGTLPYGKNPAPGQPKGKKTADDETSPKEACVPAEGTTVLPARQKKLRAFARTAQILGRLLARGGEKKKAGLPREKKKKKQPCAHVRVERESKLSIDRNKNLKPTV